MNHIVSCTNMESTPDACPRGGTHVLTTGIQLVNSVSTPHAKVVRYQVCVKCGREWGRFNETDIVTMQSADAANAQQRKSVLFSHDRMRLESTPIAPGYESLRRGVHAPWHPVVGKQGFF